MPASTILRAVAGLAAVFSAALSTAQSDITVLSLDLFRTDRISGESRHEILPVAVFDRTRFQAIAEPGVLAEANARREQLLSANPAVQVFYRGRRVGTLHVSDVYSQAFDCHELNVGSGAFEQISELPESEVTHAIRGSGEGRRFDYLTHSYIALSGALDEPRSDGDALITDVSDSVELERYAADVASVAPRANLLPLGEDQTRAYRLDRYDAVVVVRKRRSAAMLQGPVGMEFKSSLMTDIVVVRTSAGEREVHPLFLSTLGMDAMGQGGPDDVFMDAFELEAGTVYLAFERRGYESHSLLLYRLEADGGATLAFEDGLYGC
jgi:hypothetical protein